VVAEVRILTGSPRARRLLANLLLSMVSFLATLAALEGLLRLRARRPTINEAETRLQWIEPDPLLGWRKRAGGRATYRRPEYTVEVVANSQGLRDRERPYEARESFRILALGDSFVEAHGVPFESMVSQRLERSLSRSACPVEVINGGTQGYSTDQEYLFYLSEGARYAPRVVVLFFYYNDVLYNARAVYFGLPKPRLEIREGQLLPSGPLPASAPRSLPTGEALEPARNAGSDRSFLDGSLLVTWTRDRLRRGAPRAYNSLAALGLWQPIAVRTPFVEIKVYRREKVIPEIEQGWEMTGHLLESLAREAEARGAAFLVAYVPARMEVHDADWELTRIKFGMDDERWDRGRVLSRLEEIGRAARFPVLDLTPALRRADRRILGGPYYAGDLHWNARGHEVAAAEVEAFLRRSSWLPPCAR
jgi:hypothetical protein